MNLAVESVTGSEPPRPDVGDWITRIVFVGGFVASWVFVFAHPSTGSFGIAVGGTSAWAMGFHLINVRDDKQPDRK